MRNKSESVSRDMDALIESAKQGKIDPLKFCAALEERGIVGAAILPYLLRAFEIKFEDAKKILIKYHHGSVDAWAEEMSEVVDQLSQEDIGLQDGSVSRGQ